MWASSQPRENEQCLLRGAQNSLSQWNVPASQAEGNFNFFFKPWWELLARRTGRRGSAMWGLRLARVAGLAAEGHCYICPFPLETVTSPAGLCVGLLPQMRGCCWRGLLGCPKRKLSQAAARAAGQDKRTGSGPCCTSGSL